MALIYNIYYSTKTTLGTGVLALSMFFYSNICNYLICKKLITLINNYIEYYSKYDFLIPSTIVATVNVVFRDFWSKV